MIELNNNLPRAQIREMDLVLEFFGRTGAVGWRKNTITRKFPVSPNGCMERLKHNFYSIIAHPTSQFIRIANKS